MLTIKMPFAVYLDTMNDIKKLLIKEGFTEKNNTERRKNHVCLSNQQYDFYLPLFYVEYFIIYRVKEETVEDYFLSHSLQPKKIISAFKRYHKKTKKQNETVLQKTRNSHSET